MAKRVTDGFGKVQKILTVIPPEIRSQLEKEEWALHTTDEDVANSIRNHLEEKQLDATLCSIKHGNRELSGYMVSFEMVMYLRSRKLQRNEAAFTAYHRVNREAKWEEWQEGKKHVGTLAARGLLDTADKTNFRAEVQAARKASK